jgi:hypothetical protein
MDLGSVEMLKLLTCKNKQGLEERADRFGLLRSKELKKVVTLLHVLQSRSSNLDSFAF